MVLVEVQPSGIEVTGEVLPGEVQHLLSETARGVALLSRGCHDADNLQAALLVLLAAAAGAGLVAACL